MAVLAQLQLDGSSTVYDINDARISSTSVSTATHFLGTNSSVSAINPISAADLASVLGEQQEIAEGTIYSSKNVGDIVIELPKVYGAAFFIIYGYQPDFVALVQFVMIGTQYSIHGRLLLGGMGANKIYYSVNPHRIVVKLNQGNSQGCVLAYRRNTHTITMNKVVSYSVSDMTELELT